MRSKLYVCAHCGWKSGRYERIVLLGQLFCNKQISLVADEEKDENLCAYYDEDDCRFAYVYWYDENNKVMIKAQEERECPPKVNFIHFMY